VSLANEVDGSFRGAGGVASDFQGGLCDDLFLFPLFSLLLVLRDG
jgi:hypothetical protein